MKKRLLSILMSLFLFAGCESWLDVVPEEDMTTIDTDFETRDQAYTWLKSCYVFFTKNDIRCEYERICHRLRRDGIWILFVQCSIR